MGKSWDSTGIANNVEMWKETLRVLKPGGHLLAFSGTRTYHRMASAIEDAGFEVRDMIEWVYGSGFPKSLNVQKQLEKIGRDKYAEFQGVGTALKPAHEPICMARKPLSEKTVTENCLKWGTGGINIDKSRVGYMSEEDKKESITKNQYKQKDKPEDAMFVGIKNQGDYQPQGRFPANIIHDNSEEVRDCFPESKSSDVIRRNNQSKNTGAENGAICYGKYNDCDTTGYSDSGNASRFFKSIIYQAKASKSERNKGLDDFEEVEVRGGGGRVEDGYDLSDPAQVNLRRAATAYGAVKAKKANIHPTVKPIALMEYLIKMVTPKGGIVLDPFAGSGSTLVAAKQNGFQYIGIEMTEEYIPIINARLKIKTNEIRRHDD